MNELFDMQTVLMDSPRLAEIKAADIQTHHAPHMEEEPWLAIPMHAARQRLKGYITKDEPFNTVADITASFGRLLDDCGMLFYGETESEVQDAALAYVKLSSSGDVGNTTGGDSVPTEAPHQSGVIDGVEVPPVVNANSTLDDWCAFDDTDYFDDDDEEDFDGDCSLFEDCGVWTCLQIGSEPCEFCPNRSLVGKPTQETNQ